ncbi:hypothetical protein SGFS_012460 [Streptomyces graminofaciens]|uniref:Secreted protein n=1 Tax=Streptomyces graminofaciens TaxID=68212 RepID=A0ABM7F2R8_9ACTN|nr:hypothetical protein SGFS_012460 [Streptomyces graminofaciens]
MLLVVVLALGVFVMHTVGHPEEHSGRALSAHAPGTTKADPPAAAHGAETSPSTDRPAVPMDMTSLCVAVLLAVWVLAALVRAALARRTDRSASLLARMPMGLRPNPPPPRPPDLTRLSVLRL